MCSVYHYHYRSNESYRLECEKVSLAKSQIPETFFHTWLSANVSQYMAEPNSQHKEGTGLYDGHFSCLEEATLGKNKQTKISPTAKHLYSEVSTC